MAENNTRAPSSKAEDHPTGTREEQEELARHSHIHTLNKQQKIETLTTIDLFDLPALLRHRPDEPGSFKEIYHQHQAEVHTAILNRRFLPEWQFIAPDGAEWDPLAPIPDAYRERIEMTAYHEGVPIKVREMGAAVQDYDLVWPGFGQERDRLERYNDVVGGGLIFLAFLQHMEHTVSNMEREIMRAWRIRFSKSDVTRTPWILPWAERNLHRALLVLWSMNLIKSTQGKEIWPVEYEMNWHRKLRQLTGDEGKLIVQLSEAIALWHLGRPDADISTEAPTKITPAGWMYRQWFLISAGAPFGDLRRFFENKNGEP